MFYIKNEQVDRNVLQYEAYSLWSFLMTFHLHVQPQKQILQKWLYHEKWQITKLISIIKRNVSATNTNVLLV